jgi:hypothetical protein
MRGPQRSAAVDSASRLDERFEPNSRPFALCREPQRPGPLADGLVIDRVLTGATDDDGERVGVHIDWKHPSELERTTNQFPPPTLAAPILYDPKHRAQVPVDSIPSTILLKRVPSVADVGKSLSN